MPKQGWFTAKIWRGDRPIFLSARVKDATQNVEVNREAVDVLEGKRGNTLECADAACAKRRAAAFPHPVLFVHQTAYATYVCAKMNRQGNPTLWIRYTRPQGDTNDINLFDKTGPDALLASGHATKTIRFLAPSKTRKLGARHGSHITKERAAQMKKYDLSHPEKRKEIWTRGNARVSVHRGELRRAIAAGIIMP